MGSQSSVAIDQNKYGAYGPSVAVLLYCCPRLRDPEFAPFLLRCRARLAAAMMQTFGGHCCRAGIIREADYFRKGPEFEAWMAEVKHVEHVSSMTKWDLKEYVGHTWGDRHSFSRQTDIAPELLFFGWVDAVRSCILVVLVRYFQSFMEDYNTATMKSEKYYDLEKWCAPIHRPPPTRRLRASLPPSHSPHAAPTVCRRPSPSAAHRSGKGTCGGFAH